MLVVVDMGNTNITMGLFKDDQLIGNYRLTTKLNFKGHQTNMVL